MGFAHSRDRTRKSGITQKAEVRSCPLEENPKRIPPLWHAFDYFPRERKVIAGAGCVSPHSSCRDYPANPSCGATRPTPSETFLCEESFTKSTQGTTWFLDLQRRGSYLTPFEPPYIGSKCARQRHSAVRSGTPVFVILPLPEQTGGENFASQSSRGSIFLRKSTENGLCPFSGPHTEKRDNAESRGAVLPLRGVSKEDTSSLARL